MNITGINISNFLGARSVDISLRKPVALFCGSNYAGKSSIQEAVRHALAGESVRVDQKKDLGKLLTDGTESGFAEVTCRGEKYSIMLPSGKGMHSQNEFLPYVLDAQRFARLEPNARRSFLFGLMGLKVGAENVKRRLSDRGRVSEEGKPGLHRRAHPDAEMAGQGRPGPLHHRDCRRPDADAGEPRQQLRGFRCALRIAASAAARAAGPAEGRL